MPTPTSFTITFATAPSGSVTTKGQLCGSGGLAAANAFCLRDLTTNTGWFGYSSMQTAGLLTASHVKAFLCNGTTCQNPNPNTSYYYGNGADPSAGGGTFKTDANGLGPNDALGWARADHFAGTYGFFGSLGIFTGRGTGSSLAWPNTSAANTCGGWTTTSGNGEIGMPSNTNATRWAYSTAACTSGDIGVGSGVVCMVNP